MNRLIASATGLPAWALILAGIFAVSLAVCTAIVIGEEHQDGDLIPLNDAAERRLREHEAELAGMEQHVGEWFPQAISRLCGPCTGHPGTVCICKEKCANPLCGADDTVVHDLIGELETMLRSEGGGQ